jgi:hypothetical protein
MHLHFLVTEGGTDEAGVFHKIPRIDDSRLAEIFAREVLAMLVRKELLSPEWAERILSWPHSGFNVHSRIFIARVTSHIPDKGQVMVRCFGLYANAHRGKVKKASQSPTAFRIVEEELRRLPHGGCRRGSDNGASEADVCGSEASAVPCLRAGRPRGGRGERGIFLPSKYAFLARLSHFSVSLTSPSGQKYITGVVKRGDSSAGAGIRGVTEKGNTYPLQELR